MGNYYEVINNIQGGYPANADSINSIQLSTEMAFDTSISDLMGDAFVLGATEDAFKMTPAIPQDLPNTIGGKQYYIDQVNDNGGVASNGQDIQYYNLKDMYLSQKISLSKSSVENMYVIMTNTGDQDGSITFTMKQPDVTGDEGTIYGTTTVKIPANTITTYSALSPLQIGFGIDHLPSGIIEMVISPADPVGVDGINIVVDENANYATGGGLLESPDNSHWNETGFDLWFIDEYATNATFDINPDIGILRGEVVPNFDTHVNIPSASAYGDRIDLVCLNPNGFFEVIAGEIVSKYPVASFDKLPQGYLPISSVYIQENKSKAIDMVINQDDSVGEFRLRNYNERLRRLEKFKAWALVKDEPKHIEYTISGSEIIDNAESTNIIWNTNAITPGIAEPGAVILGDLNSDTEIWTLEDQVRLDLTKTQGIDLSESGVAKLASSSDSYTESTYYTSQDFGTYLGGKDLNTKGALNTFGTFNVNPSIYPDNSHPSTYPAIYEYIQEAGYLHQINAAIWNFRNVDNVYAGFYKLEGTYGGHQADRHNPVTFIEKSEPVPITGTHVGIDEGVSRGQWDQIKNPTAGIFCNFSGTTWVTPGWYVFIFTVDPIKHSQPCEFLIGTWNAAGIFDGRKDYKDYTEFGEFTGRFPMNKITEAPHFYKKGYTDESIARFGYTALRSTGSCSINHSVTLGSSHYISQGTLYSSTVVPAGNISSVTMDENMSLPPGTGYLVEVSNDGGDTWQAVRDNQVSFGEGRSFVWRITLTSNDPTVTPEIYFDSNDGYAIKAILALTGVSNKGCLVTPIFDGDSIISDALEEPTRDLFSHWQWARLWATAPMTKEDEPDAGTKLWVNIEGSDDEGNDKKWTRVKAAMRLGDLYHGDIDFSDYEGAFDPDEYNYEAEVDPLETQPVPANPATDLVVIEPCTDTTKVLGLQGGNTDEHDVTVPLGGGFILPTLLSAIKGPLWAINNSDGYDLSGFKQIRMKLQVTANADIASGDLEFWLCSEQAADEEVENYVLEKFEIPHIQQGIGVDTEVAFNLDKPIELSNVKSFVINGVIAEEIGYDLQISDIQATPSADYHFYEKYLRMRICMYKQDPSNESPMVRQVGVVPVIL